MNRLEDELRIALGRREPPAGFADRVMARIPDRRPRVSWFGRAFMAAAAAILIAVLAAGSWQYQRAQQRRAEAEQARVELLFALELTSVKLQSARSKLLRQTGGTI